MTFLEKYLKLSQCKPFDKLDKNTLAVVAQVCESYTFEASQVIMPEAMLPTHLFIATEGAFVEANTNIPKTIFSISNILKYEEFKNPYLADEKLGAKALVITREHFLAIAKNYPLIMVEFAKMLKEEKAEI